MTVWLMRISRTQPIKSGKLATFGAEPESEFTDEMGEGDDIFVHVDGTVIAYGTLRDDSYDYVDRSQDQFDADQSGEYHRSVAWHYILEKSEGIRQHEVRSLLDAGRSLFSGTIRQLDTDIAPLVEEIRNCARHVVDRPEPGKRHPIAESEDYYFDLPALHSALWLFGDLQATPTAEEAVPAAEGLVEHFANWGPYRETETDSHQTSLDFTTEQAEELVDKWSSDLSLALEDRLDIEVEADTIAALGREMGLGSFPTVTNDYLLNHLWDISAHLNSLDPDSPEGPNSAVDVFANVFDELPEELCEHWQNRDVEGNPINEIRREAMSGYTEGRLSSQLFETIQQHVIDEYERDVTTGWRDYTILAGIYYQMLKPRLRHHFNSLASEVLSFIGDEGLRKHVVDFMGSVQKVQEFGWFCIYPSDEGESHKDNYQLFVGIHHNYATYGLHVGKNIRSSDWRTHRDRDRVDRPNDVFRFEDVEEKLKSVKPEFDRLNEFGPGGEEDESRLDPTEPLEADLDASDVTGLHFPSTMSTDLEGLVEKITAALNSGNHIIFTGPPGTGKTEIAEQVADALTDSQDDLYTGSHVTTATADWSTFETIGGYMPSREGDSDLEFRPGQLLRRFKRDGRQRNDITVIDEINRSDIDKAFGQLFTVLSGQRVQLPYETKQGNEIQVRPANEEDRKPEDEDEDSSGTDLALEEYVVPESWRLMATMNSYDKTSLYDMSYAFMRRFTFIRVDAPSIPGVDDTDPTPEEFIQGYLDEWEDIDLAADDPAVAGVLAAWRVMNDRDEARSLGPAIAKDMLGYVERLPYRTDEERKQAVADAVVGYAFPQLEGMLDRQRQNVIDALASASGIDEETIQSAAREQFRT